MTNSVFYDQTLPFGFMAALKMFILNKDYSQTYGICK
jgi:hypothetical protein